MLTIHSGAALAMIVMNQKSEVPHAPTEAERAAANALREAGRWPKPIALLDPTKAMPYPGGEATVQHFGIVRSTISTYDIQQLVQKLSRDLVDIIEKNVDMHVVAYEVPVTEVLPDLDLLGASPRIAVKTRAVVIF